MSHKIVLSKLPSFRKKISEKVVRWNSSQSLKTVTYVQSASALSDFENVNNQLTKV